MNPDFSAPLASFGIFFPLSSVCLAELLCYSFSMPSIETIPPSFLGCLHVKTPPIRISCHVV